MVNYEGVSTETAITMTRYLEWSAYQNQDLKGRPPFILLKIDYHDRNYLKKGMRIKVSGYKVAGDEGGTWTSFTGIEILLDVLFIGILIKGLKIILIKKDRNSHLLELRAFNIKVK